VSIVCSTISSSITPAVAASFSTTPAVWFSTTSYTITSTAASPKEQQLGAVSAVEAARVINELIQLAKDMREASKRGEKLKMSEDEFLHSMKPLRSMAPQLKSWAMKHSSN
jgi:hypothetical protein